MKKLLLLPLLIFLFSNQAVPSLIGQPGDKDCMPGQEFRIGGIRLLDRETKVRKILGKPRIKIREASEDETGQFFINTWHYENFNLEIVRGLVTRIYTRSPAARTPSGLHPGMNYDQVLEILGRKPTDGMTSGKLLSFPSCHSGEAGRPMVMKLVFDPKQILNSIDLNASLK